MFRKSIITFAVASTLILGTVSPVLAQDNTGNDNTGGFGNFIQLLQRIFSQNRPVQNQFDNQNTPMMRNEATGGGQVSQTQMEENRLSGLVKAGKITEAQKQAILTEVQKIQDEITAWSKSAGLSVSYIYGGLRGPGIDAGIGSRQNDGEQGEPNKRMVPPQGGMMYPGSSGQPQTGGPRPY